MKKISTTIILLICFLHQAAAQIKLGVKVGANVANVRKIGDENNTPRIGINTGAVAQFNVNNHFIIKPELLFSSKGYKFPANSFNNGGTMNLNYITIPLLAGFKPSKDITMLLGPEFGFLTNANARIDPSYTDVTSRFRKSDIAIDAGVAINIKKGLGIELRYCYGLNDLSDVILTDNLGNEYGRARTGANRIFQLGFFYLFTLK